ncbi:Glycosyl phosphatidyl inositol anchor synthesis [Geranomyces variabilis]|nr:Glycosyl phosphatidyl inositol anchor synthesis [Geranomyces variabilis]
MPRPPGPAPPDKAAARPAPSLTTAVVRLIGLGILFHAIYSWSIFDIYFRSPLVHGMQPVVPSQQPPPARRLLLVVADGLRADKLFERRLERAPFLREVVMEKGRWGVSHTRVPTESRPGHVALIAGFYEDVSAVTKGWKMNPVTFDSVFNQSSHTWSFGSPDILPMFAHGVSDPTKVEAIMYPQESEDFAADASKLDTWVFDKFDELLAEGRKNATLGAMMRQQGAVFFLHLLGLDTNGHAYRPESNEYLDNIAMVDDGLRKAVASLDTFFENDGNTAYVFTADHGMSNQGNHGDGNPDNTQTPLIAWGSGVPLPARPSGPKSLDGLTEAWDLADQLRVDVEQADIAPLMSSLIGVPYPMNSVGVLPLAYRAGTVKVRSVAAFDNARQILEQYRVKSEKKRRHEPFFKPFAPLARNEERVAAVAALIDSDRYEQAIEQSQELIKLCLKGMRYYETYDWLFLRSVISSGYLGWIAYSTLFILRAGAPHDLKAGPRKTDTTVTVFAAAAFAALSLFLYSKDSPVLYYAYIAFPVYFWTECLRHRADITSLTSSVLRSRTQAVMTAGTIAFYIGALEILVFSYFRREVLTPCLWALGLLWPQTFPAHVKLQNRVLIASWGAACIATSVFPLLSAEKRENPLLVAAGGLAIVASGVFAYVKLPAHIAPELPESTPAKAKVITGAQAAPRQPVILVEIAIAIVSVLTTLDTTFRLRAKTGLPLLNQSISWSVLALAGLIPLIDAVHRGQHYLRRLTVLYLAFAPVFVQLTISYEALFYVCFSAVLGCWLSLERLLYEDASSGSAYGQMTSAEQVSRRRISGARSLQINDLRIAATFLLLTNVAFFGTGNMASVSSFSLESVYRFTTVFAPFLMGALLILKILIPFSLLSSTLAVLSRAVDLPAFALFLLVLATTDIMTLNFFFLVKDHGSWLEIGTTISHFVIASAFIVFQCLMFAASWALVGKVLVPAPRGRSNRKER